MNEFKKNVIFIKEIKNYLTSFNFLLKKNLRLINSYSTSYSKQAQINHTTIKFIKSIFSIVITFQMIVYVENQEIFSKTNDFPFIIKERN